METWVMESIRLLEDDLVELRYRDNIRVTADDMHEILTQLYTLTENRKMKRLIVISKNASLELPARQLLERENKQRKDTIIAEAVVVNSLAQKMTTNFYMKFIKDIYPTRFFTSDQQALEWLKTH